VSWAAATFAVPVARRLLGGIGTHDEAWQLQVATRIGRGEALYRDVSYGAGPLPPLALRALVRRTWPELVLTRVLDGAIAAAQGRLAARVAARLGLRGRRSSGLLGLAAAVGSQPARPAAAYASAAALAQLAALDAALAGRPLRAGALAGLGASCKQTTGLLTLAALLAAVPGGGRARAQAVAGAALGAGIPLLPIARDGGLRGYLEYGYAAKGEYVRSGGLGLGYSLVAAAHIAHSTPGARHSQAKYILLPAAGLVGLGRAVAARGARRRPAYVAAAVLAAGLAGVPPRIDEEHLSHAVALALAVLAPDEPGPRGAALRTLLAAWLVAALLEDAARVRPLLAGGGAIAGAPPLRGLPVARAQLAAEQQRAAGLAALAGPERTLLILAADAALPRLMAGLLNPTPFDYPLRTTFGRDGLARLEERIRAGGFSVIALREHPAPLGTPELYRAVRETMTRAGDLAGMELYRAAGS
jgi:hypothetical protein